MTGFRHVADTEIATLARLRVVRAAFEAPDGSLFERDVVRNHEVVAMVPLFADGTVRALPFDIDVNRMKAYLTPSGGEAIAGP